MNRSIKSSFFILFCVFFSCEKINAINLEEGKTLFLKNCIACHKGGSNLIIPEKNLKKQALEANGMYNINAITYQITNGKNGMPAFGGRLIEEEIENIAFYVFKESSQNFQ